MEGAQAHGVIREIAGRQYGVLSRRQALGSGVGPGLLRHAVTSGRLLPVFTAVYAVGRPVDSYRAIWMAATLAAGTGAALAGISAAAAWGFMDPKKLIVVARPKGRRLCLDGASPDHRRIRLSVATSRLIPEHTLLIGPIATSSVPATLVQLAGTLRPYPFRRAFIEASRQGLLNHSNLKTCLSIGRSYNGISALAELIDLWHPESARVKSFMEGDFFFLCRKHGIPAPRVNAWVDGKEVDCLWSEQRVIVELDSRTFHDDSFAFDRDRVRQNAAVVSGFRVLRFTHRRINTEPEDVMRELAGVLDI